MGTQQSQPCVPTAVFDFDHTLTSRDSAAGFFIWLLSRSPLKLLIGAPVALLLSPLGLTPHTRRIALRFAVWWATFGCSHEQLRALARAHVVHVRALGGAFLRAEGRAQLWRHQSQGHAVVIATGAVEYLAQEILAQEDIHDVTVVGSSLRSFLGGMIADQHCHGERKLRMLQARGVSPPWNFVYSDSAADLPLLRAGTTQFVVNPTARTAAYLTGVLGPSATVVTWR
jgi:phosphatidylglycerophosphatase C